MTFIKATHPKCMDEQHERFLGQILGKFHTCCYTCGINAALLEAMQPAIDNLNKRHERDCPKGGSCVCEVYLDDAIMTIQEALGNAE